MKHYARSSIMIAVCISMLAGYMDAIGFLELGGYFISFMSGNSTRLAVGLVQGDYAHAMLVGGILVGFIAGATVGTVAAKLAGERRQASAVLSLVTFILIMAIFSYETGHTLPAVFSMTFAMGAANTVFQRDGDVAFGLTYMTGTLVKFGQRIAQAFFGGDRFACVPYLLLWLGLIGGGALGVFLYRFLGLHSLWLAALGSAVLTWVVVRFPPR